MGIISSSTLEGSDSLNRDAEYLDGKIKETLPKSPHNQLTHVQDCRRVTGAWETLLSPPQRVAGFPSLVRCAGPRVLSSALAEAGVALVPSLRRRAQGCHWESAKRSIQAARSVTSSTPALVPAAFMCLLYLFVQQPSQHWWDVAIAFLNSSPLQRQQITWLILVAWGLLFWTSLFKAIPWVETFIDTVFIPWHSSYMAPG